jgi:hypothetical protein
MIIISETDPRFYIKDSSIEGAGSGVFSQKKIQKGNYLEIIGVMVKSDSTAHACTQYANKYKFASNEEITHQIVPMGFAAIINHAIDQKEQNVEIEFIKDSLYKNYKKKNPAAGPILYRVIKDINKDEEVLGYYGDPWNKILRWTDKYKEEDKGSIDSWETFISHDLYNLGLLKQLFD